MRPDSSPEAIFSHSSFPPWWSLQEVYQQQSWRYRHSVSIPQTFLRQAITSQSSKIRISINAKTAIIIIYISKNHRCKNRSPRD